MKVLIVLCVTLPCVLGFFNNVELLNQLSNTFPVRIIQCLADVDTDGILKVFLNTSIPEEVPTPFPSRFAYPTTLSAFRDITRLNYSQDLQRIDRPTDEEFSQNLSFPLRYDIPDNADYRGLQAICGEDVLGNVTDGITRNQDQGTFHDISNNLENNWLRIWNMTDQTQYPDVSMTAWRSDIIGLFRLMLQVLSCRVAFKWADAGGSFFPRYYRGGFCNDRNCSLPDRDEFRCHPDLSDSESRFLEAYRWDCCWTGVTQYECGLRQVRFPIVCDCDCRCADKAGI